VAFALLALGLGALQFVLDNGERREWFADRGIALAAVVALAALVSFVVRELRDRREPVVDLHVFRYRSVAVGALLGFAFGIVVFAPAIVTPLYGSSILTYTASESGLLLVARAIPVVLLTPIFATIAQRGFDVRYLLAAGFVLTAFALTWLQSAMTSSSPFAALAVPLFVSGIGQSMLLVPLIVGVLSTTPAELNGRVSPIITLAVQLGGSFASACVVTLFDRRLAFHADVLAGATASPHLAAIGFHVDGSSLAQLAALVQQEAGTLAYADTMAALALVALLVSPIVAAFPRSKATAA
jgi:DHA2 family multidrug resistance protein